MTERNTPHGDAVTTCRPPAHGRPYWHGALLALVIGSFGVPAILGARTPVLAVKAYNEFVSEMGGNPQMQTTMASLLVCLGAGLLLVQKFIVERRQFQMEAGRTPAALTIRGVPAVLASGGVLFVVALSLLPANGKVMCAPVERPIQLRCMVRTLSGQSILSRSSISRSA